MKPQSAKLEQVIRDLQQEMMAMSPEAREALNHDWANWFTGYGLMMTDYNVEAAIVGAAGVIKLMTETLEGGSKQLKANPTVAQLLLGIRLSMGSLATMHK